MASFCMTVRGNTLRWNFFWGGYESLMTSAITRHPPCTGEVTGDFSGFLFCFPPNSSHSILDSYEMIADGEEHRVELLAIKKNFTMRVDGGRARSIINDGEKDMLKLTTPLFIGGLPSNVASTALNLWHLRNSTSFHGELLTTFSIFPHYNSPNS